MAGEFISHERRLLGVEGHRAVDVAAVLNEGDGVGTRLGQVMPDLAEPGLGVALRRKLGHLGVQLH